MARPTVPDATQELLVELEAALDQAAELLDERLPPVLDRIDQFERQQQKVGLSAQEEDTCNELDAWVRRVEAWTRTRALARLAIIRALKNTSARRLRPADVSPVAL